MHNVAMAGRHVASEYAVLPHELGHSREVARDSGPFWSYLDRFTVRSYVRDFFLSENHRSIIGVVVGVLFVVGGFVRMFPHPGWQSLGVMLVGVAITLFFFVVPLLLDLAFAYAGALGHRVRRPRGRRRKR